MDPWLATARFLPNAIPGGANNQAHAFALESRDAYLTHFV
jgi:hypothetical protein